MSNNELQTLKEVIKKKNEKMVKIAEGIEYEELRVRRVEDELSDACEPPYDCMLALREIAKSLQELKREVNGLRINTVDELPF